MEQLQGWEGAIGAGAVVLLYGVYLLLGKARPKAAPPKPAVVNCPDCGGKVSTKVNACPHCGRPMT